MTFHLTQAEFDAKAADLAAHGITISGVTGTIEAKGVTASYSYDPSLSELTVLVLNYGGHARFFVDHAIRGWFAPRT